MAKIVNGKCTGGWFCDGARASTAAERRAYDDTVKALGGERSPAGRAFIEREHRRFLASEQEHRRRYH